MFETSGPLIAVGGIIVTVMLTLAKIIVGVFTRRMDAFDKRMDNLSESVGDITDKYETHLYWHMEHPAAGD